MGEGVQSGRRRRPRAMLADDFLSLDSDGTMYGKSDVMARTKKAKWVTNELSDMKVAVHGDSAVVTGSWTGNGTDGAGKAIDTKERWVDTWVKTALANGSALRRPLPPSSQIVGRAYLRRGRRAMDGPIL